MKRKNIVIMVLTALLIIVTGMLGFVLVQQAAANKAVMLEKGSEVDLIMFMGQSNMSGTGESEKAPAVIEGAGYEFRAISDPTRLYPIEEPFGENENNVDGVDDEDLKTGSLVSAFVNSYYSGAGVPVVAISASAGGSTIHSWRKDGTMLPDAVDRYNAAKTWLTENGYVIRHSYMVWLQGESDGNKQTSKEDYIASIKDSVSVMQDNGIEKCFIIRIGIRTEEPGMYDTIIEAQTELCKENEDFILISTKAVELETLELMRDEVHYTQGGLNLIGEEAGANMAYYVKTGMTPALYDSVVDDVYSDTDTKSAE
ncbi:sialate O-acetylesterase [Konateibacter massiliensis]|uniref:sialate O-acetylesterase n=1 Tax=Konateibacter massiliensis TaxID=2002841 RepID=UPI000C14EFBF|nr:sialate O-acetylesterase [Konateibacter massiliensis]